MSGMFAPKPQPAPAPPPVIAPAPIPDQNSPAAVEANRLAQMKIMGQAGRSSTILTAPTQRGGGGDYSSAKLGSAN